jgi:hypothetical protein
LSLQTFNYWYVARPNELFIDTDNVHRSIKHAKSRLQGAIESQRLDVDYVMSHHSRNKNHLHTIITLKNPITNVERYVWEIMLHGDIYRACCNIMRSATGVPSPDILISPFHRFCISQYGKTMRLCDDSCTCESKHNFDTMLLCPAAIRLRGESRVNSFFGKPSKNPCTIWRQEVTP